ncbi:MAG: helix-turn-helix transcriptional regulator [Jiangellaceae bacterium]
MTLTYVRRPDAETLMAYGEALDATVAAIPGRGFTVMLHEPADDPITAATKAARRSRRVVADDPTGIEALTDVEYERQALEPNVPEIVSAAEAADILGVSRQRLHQLRRHPRFPAPLYELRTGPLWTRDAIEWFVGVWERKPGRPALRSA